MAHQELGQFDEAHRFLDMAERTYGEICQTAVDRPRLSLKSKPISADRWHWMPSVQQLRREAREKIEGTPPPDDPWQHLIQARGYQLIGDS